MRSVESTPFRGWWIVAVAFVTQSVAVGVTFGSFPVFLVPIAEAFDVGLMEVSVGMSLLMATSTLAGVVVGPLLDRQPIRVIMASGAVLQSVCLGLMSQATALWQLGLLFGLGMALGVALLGPLASATLVAKWFERQLGRAQGIANTGGPAGVGLFAILGGSLIGTLGWRETLLVYAGVALCAAPLVWWVVRSRPEEIGQLPDGEPRPVFPSGGPAPEGSPPSLFLLRTFWLLVLPVGLLIGVATGWGSQVVALGVDLGFENAVASNILGASALLGIFGTLAFGALSDRAPGRALLWAIMAIHAASFLALAAAPSERAFYAVVPILGFLGGGMMPVYAALIGRLFGSASFGRVMGQGGLIMTPIAVVAPSLGASLRDETGSYALTLVCFAVGMVAGIALLLGLRVPGRPAAAASAAGSTILPGGASGVE